MQSRNDAVAFFSSGGCGLIGTEFQFCKIKEFLEMDSGEGYTTV